MTGNVYVSYAAEDREYAQRLAAHLQSRGVPVWLDTMLQPGEQLDTVALRQLEASTYVLVVMSPAAARSSQVADETAVAVADAKEIIPLLLDGEVLPSLAHLTVVDVRGGALPGDDLVARLLATVDTPRKPSTGDAGPKDGSPRWMDFELSIGERTPPPPAAPVPPPPPAGESGPGTPGGLPPVAGKPTEPVPASQPVPSTPELPVPVGPLDPGAVAPVPPRPEPDGVPRQRASAPGPDLEWVDRSAGEATRAGGGTPGLPAAGEPDGRLEFAAAYQQAIQRGARYPLLFVVHRPWARDLVRDLIARRRQQLGGDPTVSEGGSAATVPDGTTLSIVPNVIGVEFEPARVDVIAGNDVREVTFQYAASPQTPLGTIEGNIDIFVGPLIIGQVPVTFTLAESSNGLTPNPTPPVDLMAVTNATIFDKIFISYSHRDSAIIDVCRATYEQHGVKVLVDHVDLRSGEDWRSGLEKLIGQADIFQLYWSKAASASEEVGKEWRLALTLSKTRNRFIRPLYWESPMPPPPEALSHLHFAKIDLKDLKLKGKVAKPAGPGLVRRLFSALRGGADR